MSDPRTVAATARKPYGLVVPGLMHGGRPVQGGVFDENVVRGSAGIALALSVVALVQAHFAGNYLPIQALSIYFSAEFLLRVSFGLQASPLGLLAKRLTRRQAPHWASARPMRFAWSLGLALAVLLMALTNGGVRGPVPELICLACIALMWCETALGICLGCEIHGLMVRRGWIAKDPAYEICAHGACAIGAPR